MVCKKWRETNFSHLQERIRSFDGIEMSKEQFLEKIKERLAITDVEMVKRDVLPFIKNPEELEISSNNYFLQLAKMMRFEGRGFLNYLRLSTEQ